MFSQLHEINKAKERSSVFHVICFSLCGCCYMRVCVCGCVRVFVTCHLAQIFNWIFVLFFSLSSLCVQLG